MKVYEPNKVEAEINRALVLIESLKSSSKSELVQKELLKIRKILVQAKDFLE